MRELSVVKDALLRPCGANVGSTATLPLHDATLHLLTGRFARGRGYAGGGGEGGGGGGGGGGGWGGGAGREPPWYNPHWDGRRGRTRSSQPGGTGPKRSTIQKAQRRRGGRSKTALVLGGGGFTGGVYEIGALRALDLLSVNRTVNEFDIYVGTSAGSFVASLLAAGLTPEEMSRVVNRQVPTPFRDVDLGALLRPNYADFATRSRSCPCAWRAWPAVSRVAGGRSR